MKIEIAKIPPEGLEIQTEESKNFINIDDKNVEFIDPISISLKIDLAADELIINGVIKTNVELVCSRCLKKTKQSLVSNKFNLMLDVRDIDNVDISDDIREEILMLLPVKPLCRDDCSGICPKCGQDLNIKKCSCKIEKQDLRWSNLNKIKLKEE